MLNHVNRTSAPESALVASLGELRQRVLAGLIGNSLFTEAEQLRANHSVHECEDVTRLIRWGANVQAELARRQVAQAAAACQPCSKRATQLYSKRATQPRLRSVSFHQPSSRPRRLAPAWVPGACLPIQADHRASTRDLLAAARFRSARTLTYSQLLRR